MNNNSETLIVGLAQIAPVWLNRDATVAKVVDYIEQANQQNCQLVVFGEALIPGYPFWLERTDGARFNSQVQKDFHAVYLDQAIQIEAGHLAPICDAAKEHDIAVYVGTIERAADRGGHSLYCSLVFIDSSGSIQSIHRKLMPTYEERLAWSPGDGHGLRVHQLNPFTVGALNCWENWMPLARTALYAQGEDLHVAVWPGARRTTIDITRFMALEGRSFVVSVSGLMRKSDIPQTIAHYDAMMSGSEDVLADGGSCVAAPDGSWVLEPIVGHEQLAVVTIDYRRVREERQNFDPVGHYARPDVTQLFVNRERQGVAWFRDEADRS
ncbi:MAG: carbon-nitrogen hydrolase family protein [candidate division Zixibacteria bacterium]|nr:carbon-nitrogen hydrolase family protein [candidate division Zixibacteria bacterium]